MVQQQAEGTQPALPAEQEGSSEFAIQDETSPEQLEREAQADSESDAVQVPDVEDATTLVEPEIEEPEAPAPATPEVPVEQAQPPEQAEPVEEEQPAPRTYSVEEVARIQAAKDREIAEERARVQQMQAEQDRLQLERNVETTIAQQEAELTPSIGEAEARRLARSAQNVAAVRQGQEAIQRASRLEQQNNEILQGQEDVARQVVARQMMEKHGLQAADYELLLGTTGPTAMETLAERLSNQTLQERQQAQARTAQVPAETPQTALENGQSTGQAAESPEQRLRRINAMNADDWSKADWEFMRTGR